LLGLPTLSNSDENERDNAIVDKIVNKQGITMENTKQRLLERIKKDINDRKVNELTENLKEKSYDNKDLQHLLVRN